MCENTTFGVHEWNKNRPYTEKVKYPLFLNHMLFMIYLVFFEEIFYTLTPPPPPKKKKVLKTFLIIAENKDS